MLMLSAPCCELSILSSLTSVVNHRTTCEDVIDANKC